MKACNAFCSFFPLIFSCPLLLFRSSLLTLLCVFVIFFFFLVSIDTSLLTELLIEACAVQAALAKCKSRREEMQQHGTAVTSLHFISSFFFSLLSLSLFGVFARIAYHTTSILMDKQKKKGGEKVVLHFI